MKSVLGIQYLVSYPYPTESLQNFGEEWGFAGEDFLEVLEAEFRAVCGSDIPCGFGGGGGVAGKHFHLKTEDSNKEGGYIVAEKVAQFKSSSREDR